ncbi:MAG: hypothetical protein OXI30_07630 [Chloroflexota bacterium]|nr:hypothetical protein [Chloroflexota bacterium]
MNDNPRTVKKELAELRECAGLLLQAGYAVMRTKRVYDAERRKWLKVPVNGWNLVQSPSEFKSGEYIAVLHCQSNVICIDADVGDPDALVARMQELKIDFTPTKSPGGWHYWIPYINARKPAAQPYKWRGIEGEIRRGYSYTVIYEPRVLIEWHSRNRSSHSRSAVEQLMRELLADKPMMPSKASAWRADGLSNPGLKDNTDAYRQTILNKPQRWRDLPYGSARRAAAETGHAAAQSDIEIAERNAVAIINKLELDTKSVGKRILTAYCQLAGRALSRDVYASRETIARMANCHVNSVDAWRREFAEKKVIRASGYRRWEGSPQNASASWIPNFQWYQTCAVFFDARMRVALGLVGGLQGDLFFTAQMYTNRERGETGKCDHTKIPSLSSLSSVYPRARGPGPSGRPDLQSSSLDA